MGRFPLRRVGTGGAMAKKRHRNELLRALLAESEWTHADLARAVNAAGAESGLALSYDRTSVAHWLSGTRPRHPVPAFIGESLTRRLGRTITPTVAGFPGSRAAVGGTADAVDGDDAVARLAELAGADADPVLRIPMRQSAYRSNMSVVDPWKQSGRPPRRIPKAAGRVAGTHEVRTLKAAVRFFSAGFDAHGGMYARATVARYLADEVTTWLRRPASDGVRRDLMSEATHLAFILARMHDDFTHHGAAQQYYGIALKLAEESGDREKWALVLRAISSQALLLGHQDVALAQAEQAYATLSSGSPAALRSFVAAQLAVSRSASGHGHGARAALDIAESSAAATTTTQQPFELYHPGALEYQRARTLMNLGDPTAAIVALTASTRRRPAVDRRGHALTLALQAQLLLRGGRLEEACAVWMDFRGASQSLESVSVQAAGHELRRTFSSFSAHPAVGTMLREETRNVPPS